MSEDNKLNDFDSEIDNNPDSVEGVDNQDVASRGIEDSYKSAASSAKNKTTNQVKKKLGVNNKTKNTSAKGIKKAGKATKKAAGKASKVVGKGAAKFASKFASTAFGSIIKVALPYILIALIVFAGISVLANFAGIVVDNEFSRTNEANYDHLDSTNGNTVMLNNVSSTGNVYYNTQTKRYELAKGKMPTESNKLYYVYYAVMSNQSRWFVNYERTDVVPTKDADGNYTTGNTANPYYVPKRVDKDKEGYTLDGYMFNQNAISKVGLSKKSSELNESDSLTSILDEQSVKAVNNMSLNVNLIYLLDSTLNGSEKGTGKNQMFFGEQFIKPVYHDENYNFKSLTAYRDMTDEEKKMYSSKAHGEYSLSTKDNKEDNSNTMVLEDSQLEKEFQTKYTNWSNMLDTQNESRGGSSGTEDDSDSKGTASGIDNPILAGAVKWGLSQLNKGITYSMGNRLGPDSYDCSAFVTIALEKGGGYQGVAGGTTVSMLQQSNALGQSGTMYKEVDLKTAKKGTIVVTGGLSGGGAGGHTFFLLEDYKGPSTKVLECSYGANGINDQGTFEWAAVNGTPIALEPAKSASGTGSSSSSDNDDSGKKNNTSRDYSMTTPNKYQYKLSTGELVAKSRVYDTSYDPDIVKGLKTKEDINYNVWRENDFYIGNKENENGISSLNSVLNISDFANNVGNSQFTAGYGPIYNDGANSKSKKSDASNILGDYKADRSELTKWSIEKGYNPAFISALITVLTDNSNKELIGNKYNFLDDPEVIKEDDKSDTDDSTKDSSTKDSSSDKETTTSSSEDEGEVTYDKNYGSDEYDIKYTVNNMSEGLDHMMDKFVEENDGYTWNEETAKKLKLSSNDYKKVNDLYEEFGGLSNNNITRIPEEATKGTLVYTYTGSGPEDTSALGVITVNGKDDDTKIDGAKKYYTKEVYVKAQDAVLRSETSGYAIERGTSDFRSDDTDIVTSKDKDGNDIKYTYGVWDHGFGSIFKISKMEYKAWKINIDEKGNYVLDSNIIDLLFNNDSKAETVQYQILGVTSPFGTMNMGNKIAEDQQAVNEIIEKLKNKEVLSDADKEVLNKHKESSTSGMGDVGDMTNSFMVSNKPSLEDEPEISDSNGAQYVLDYLTNYETYVPNTVENKLDVLARWKNMNDANADTQDASNKVTDIFNKLIGDTSDNSSSGGSSSGGLDLQESQEKAGQELYDALIDSGIGSVGAIGIMVNFWAESKWDPTTTFGVYDSPFVVSARDEANVLDATKPIGLGQWLAGRHTNLLEYAKQKNKNWYDLDLQIDFMVHGEGGGAKDVLIQVAKQTDPKKAAHGFFMAWEMHGGNMAYFDAPFDDSANANNPEGHTDEKMIQELWDKYAKENPVKADLNKMGASDSSGSSSSGSSSTNEPGKVGSWGDGSGFLSSVNQFLSEARTVVMSLFGDQEDWDPTMFATEPTYNDTDRYVLNKDGSVETTYTKDQLIINGVDAYKWVKYSNKLSEDNAKMVLRQFIANMESRDARPVYYDEIYDKFNDYDLNRIVEENYKFNLMSIFKRDAETKSNTSQVDLTGPLFAGEDFKDVKVVNTYGWIKKNDDVEFNTGITFKSNGSKDVTAMKAGTIVFVGKDGDNGNTVIVRSKNNTEQIVYTNLGKTVNLKIGEPVAAADKLGTTNSEQTVTIKGVSAKTDLSKGTDSAKEPNSYSDATSDFFDMSEMFGVSGDNIGKLVKAVNGYDIDKYPTTKPKANIFKDTKDADLKDFIKSN